MLHHVSIVQNVSIISLGITAVFQVGDANQMELKSRAIAVHREILFIYGEKVALMLLKSLQMNTLQFQNERQM